MSEQQASEHNDSILNQKELEAIQTENWSRVSPLAILYFFTKTIYTIVNSFLIYTLPAFAASYSSIKENPNYLVIGVLVLLLIILIASVAKYWFYFYKFTDDRVEIKQGLIKKSHLDLPFKKIQNVKIVQPIYYRFKNYSYIELDTAGSASQEAKIVALPLDLAESFKQMILHIKQHTFLDSSTQGTTQISRVSNAETEKLLNQRSITDLIIHGISNNRVWIVLGFLAPFYNAISENIGQILEAIGLDLASYLDYQSQSLGLFLLHVLSIVMLFMLLIVGFSVVGSILVFYNYRLNRLGDRYIRRSGLLTKHEVSMKLSRIQIVVQQQDWLDILLRRTNLRFEQNTSIAMNTGQAANINNSSKLVVPSVTINESSDLIKDAFDVEKFSEIKFFAISKRYILRVTALRLLPITLLLVGISTTIDSFTKVGYIVLASIFLFAFILVCLRWWRWGYYFTDKYVYIRKGLLGVNYCVFPLAKLQQIKFKQSIFMRANKLADIKYVLASGAYKIPLIAEDIARKQADEGLLIVAKEKPSWM